MSKAIQRGWSKLFNQIFNQTFLSYLKGIWLLIFREFFEDLICKFLSFWIINETFDKKSWINLELISKDITLWGPEEDLQSIEASLYYLIKLKIAFFIDFAHRMWKSLIGADSELIAQHVFIHLNLCWIFVHISPIVLKYYQLVV